MFWAVSLQPDVCDCRLTALAGYAAPGSKPGLALRVARAECLRDICSADPDKGAELVGLLQVR